MNEAMSAMKAGDKAASKGLFRKPDWDEASGCYDQAATAFKMAKSYIQAVQAYEKASEAYFLATSPVLAGKSLEDAAMILAQNLGKKDDAAKFYQRASELFRDDGKSDRAAGVLDKAAKLISETNPSEAAKLWEEAITILEDADRARFTSDYYKRAISLYIKSKSYENVINLLKREIKSMPSNRPSTIRYKPFLGLIITLLAYGDEVSAEMQFNEFCQKESNFMQSEEAKICDDMLKAFTECDQLLLEATVKNQKISLLDNEVGQLARSLVVPGGTASARVPVEINDRERQYASYDAPRTVPNYSKMDNLPPSRQRAELLGAGNAPQSYKHADGEEDDLT